MLFTKLNLTVTQSVCKFNVESTVTLAFRDLMGTRTDPCRYSQVRPVNFRSSTSSSNAFRTVNLAHRRVLQTVPGPSILFMIDRVLQLIRRNSRKRGKCCQLSLFKLLEDLLELVLLELILHFWPRSDPTSPASRRQASARFRHGIRAPRLRDARRGRGRRALQRWTL